MAVSLDGEIFDIIEHPYVQRLRRIRQMGLADFVYPGALHTRFNHALGSMHLMQNTIDSLRNKGQEISDDECEALLIAILLHDVGHAPFSHALEFTLLKVSHEEMSRLIMQRLEQELGGNLTLAYRIFTNQYERKFFHQLVSSQLDIDRLDYLKRDCFYTGVSEGEIGADRIIKMLDVRNDQVVVEEKGIYSIENFLNARRLMYWQVYLHKASVSAEKMLVAIIQRAQQLLAKGTNILASNCLQLFLEKQVTLIDIEQHQEYLEHYTALDDNDVWCAIKSWQHHPDRILSTLSRMLLQRKLFRIRLFNEVVPQEAIEQLQQWVQQEIQLNSDEISYFLYHGEVSNAAYVVEDQKINILTKEGKIFDVVEASDLPHLKAMSRIVKKYYVCWPK
ncbi:MAG: HD domain-containing protein, partial [Bacteroidota bacterium]